MIPYRLIAGIIAGAALGYFYYKFIGCRTGG
jgi:F0F1-type ATP synthase assembly protein I